MSLFKNAYKNNKTTVDLEQIRNNIKNKKMDHKTLFDLYFKDKSITSSDLIDIILDPSNNIRIIYHEHFGNRITNT